MNEILLRLIYVSVTTIDGLSTTCSQRYPPFCPLGRTPVMDILRTTLPGRFGHGSDGTWTDDARCAYSSPVHVLDGETSLY